MWTYNPLCSFRHRKDPEKRLRMIREHAQATGLLSGAWRIPYAAGLLHSELNLKSRSELPPGSESTSEVRIPTRGEQ